MRRSNYSQVLNSMVENGIIEYPLPELSAIYNPKILVFRGSEKDGYPYLENYFSVPFVAAAAYIRPKLELKGKTYYLNEKMAEKTKDKIRMILSIGLAHGHDSIVLSAFGCVIFLLLNF